MFDGVTSVYAQNDQEGLCSFHFEPDSQYVSYQTAPANWQLDNGDELPKRKQFEDTSFDIQKRTFVGTIYWSDTPFLNCVKQKYTMVFSADYEKIESGTCVMTKANGLVENFSYQTDYDYHRLHKPQY